MRDAYGDLVLSNAIPYNVAFKECVVARQPLDRSACIAWFSECGLAKYKVPDRIELVEEIPVLSTYQKPDLEMLRSLL